jgi:hypothetical protein
VKGLIAAFLAVIMCVIPANAGTGLTPDLIAPGGALDWINGPNNLDLQIVPLQVQYAYTYGLTYNLSAITAHRVLASPGDAETPTAYVNEFSAGVAYNMVKDFRGYVAASMSLWGEGITGQKQELYGGQAGIAFPLEGGMRMLVGYRHMVGRGGFRQTGLVFGPSFEI